MKIKYAIILAGLAVAFAAVSLWVIISGGGNAKAIKAKFRLGGLMLTVTSLLAVSGCNGGGVVHPTCYDMPAPEYVDFAGEDLYELSVGDVIEFTVRDETVKTIIYEILDTDGNMLQSGTEELTGNAGRITIAPTEYRGYIHLTISGKGEEEGSSFYLGSRSFTLK